MMLHMYALRSIFFRLMFIILNHFVHKGQVSTIKYNNILFELFEAHDIFCGNKLIA